MAEYTPNLNLVKPAQEDFYDVDDHNHNYDILDEEIPKKVDKVEGKQLSTEDYTSEEKAKLAGIDPQANKYVHPSTHSADILVDGATNKTVTAEEKNAWNAKETPDGAQAKATAAGAAALAAANDYTDQEVGALAGEGNNKTVKEIADAQASHLADNVTDTGGVHGLEIEEGTWTPVLGASTTFGSHTYTTQSGVYYKIGKKIMAGFHIALSTKDSSMSGAIIIGGIPYAVKAGVPAGSNGGAVTAYGDVGLPAGYTEILLSLQGASVFIESRVGGNNVAIGALTDGNIYSTSVITGYVEYLTD